MSTLEDLGKLLGLITAALLVLSVGYDYGYLSSVDLSFASVPTALSDHVRTAIVWAPVNGVAIAIGFLMGGVTAQVTHHSPVGHRLRWLLLLFYIGPLAVAVLVISTIFQALLLCALLVTLGGFILRGPKVFIELVGRGGAGALFMVPALLFSTTFAGSVNGPLLFSGSDRYLATVRFDSGVVEMQDVGVRRFGSFALLGEKSRKLHIIPDSNIVRVEKISTEAQPLRCLLWAALCSKKPTPSPATPRRP